VTSSKETRSLETSHALWLERNVHNLNNSCILIIEIKKTLSRRIRVQKITGDRKMTVTKPSEEYAIWLYLRDAHCTFLRKRKDLKICTNDYTVNGVHAFVFCPLIAEKYITAKLDGTTVIAFKKNPDIRIPSQMWGEIKLSQTKEKGLKELKSHAEKMSFHPVLKDELLHRAEQLFDIADELKRAPEPEEDIFEEELEEEEFLEEELLEEELEGEEDLLEEELKELKE